MYRRRPRGRWLIWNLLDPNNLMQINLKKSLRILILLNAIISFCITWNIFVVQDFSLLKINLSSLIIIIYAGLWFFCLYKLYILSNFGRIFYLYLVVVGFFFHIISNTNAFGKIYYTLSLFEHLIIGSIITIIHLTKIKSDFR